MFPTTLVRPEEALGGGRNGVGAQDPGEPGCFVSIGGRPVGSWLCRAEEERRERTIFEFMPPKQTSPARATRSGGPPGTEAPPPKKKQKKGQTNNTDTSAPVRTEAERDAMLARMEKELADLDASLAATASTGQYGLTAAETALGMQALKRSRRVSAICRPQTSPMCCHLVWCRRKP